MRQGLAYLELENEAAVAPPADLPPCGGDARQGRGVSPTHHRTDAQPPKHTHTYPTLHRTNSSHL
ncbi:hypothetical protein At1D132_17110 [Agrobacterium fabrum]|nr:hypothetical protein At1D132_17110 [Agrobacterium fabrum]